MYKKKIRDALVTSPKLFSAMLKNKRFAAVYGGLSDEDRMTRPPKGYAPDLPMIEHIKNRHFYGVAQTALNKKPPKDLAAWVGERCEAAYPLVKWLREAGR